MAYTPEQGDIIWLEFDPSSGREIMKGRPAFVISRKAFNTHVGLSIVAPITSTIRGSKLEVVLPPQLKTQGAVLVYQLKTLDYHDRQAKFIEHVPKKTVDQISQIVHVITS